MLAKLGDLDFLWLLCGVRMIRARVDLQLAIHRIAHLRLGEHAAHGEAHDALYDIKASIAELSFYRHHVFAPVCRKGAVPPRLGHAPPAR